MGYLIMILVIVIFIGIIMVLAKKDNEILNNLLSNLTEEQKRKLEDNQVENFDEKNHTWTQRAMIAEINVKGENKVALKVESLLKVDGNSSLAFTSLAMTMGIIANTSKVVAVTALNTKNEWEEK